MPRAAEQAPSGAERRTGWSGHTVNGAWLRKEDFLSSFVFLKAHFIIPSYLFDKDAFPQQKVQKNTLTSVLQVMGKHISKEANKENFGFQSSSCVCIKHLHLPGAAPDSALLPLWEWEAEHPSQFYHTTLIS